MPTITCANGKTVDCSSSFIMVGDCESGVRELCLHDISPNVQLLSRQSSLPLLGKVNAYFLPWKNNDVSNLALSDKADYFFTSNLTGCAIGFGKTDTDVVVVHSNKEIPDADTKCPRHKATSSTSGSDSDQSMSDFDDGAACQACTTLQIKARGARNTAEHKMIQSVLLETGAANWSVRTPAKLNIDNATANVFGVRADGTWSFYIQRLSRSGTSCELLIKY